MSKGQVVFVAGASSGINLAIAAKFAGSGASVAILSRDAGRIELARDQISGRGGEVAAFAADVRDYNAVEAAMQAARDQFGEITTVVSGAAGNFLAEAENLSSNGFRTVIDIDLIGTYNVFRASFAHLVKPGASLIAVSAPQGARPIERQVHACAAKAGVNMMVKVLAMEWGRQGVRVNAISPGPIGGTEGVERLWPTEADRVALCDMVALRQLGDREDIADAAYYLASQAAKFVTGVVLDVDGGFLLGELKMGAAA